MQSYVFWAKIMFINTAFVDYEDWLKDDFAVSPFFMSPIREVRIIMNHTFYEIAVLFFVYSFLAWLAETAVASVKEKNFRNRGFAAGPFCFIYGFTGTLLTVFFQELRTEPFFLFLGSAAVATAVEWYTGKTLERMKQTKWWDYSGKKWNFDGYICLQYSLLWGALGLLAVRYGNGLILGVYHILPGIVGKGIVWGLAAIGFVDFAGTFLLAYHMEEKLPRLFRWNQRLQKWTLGFASKVAERTQRRIDRAYPAAVWDRTAEQPEEEERCSLTQLFWLFLIGALGGDVVETIFCRLTAGVWMSRSSLVWGDFSVVWGLAIALITALLYKDKEKPDRHIFWVGVFLGGAYEYICSVFTEIMFGQVFWDYSGMPFNLGGRINLLYCFFWGIAAVVWMKGMYPKVSRLIAWIRKKTGRFVTAVLMLFMAADLCVSVMALVRYDMRANGMESVSGWEKAMDEHFDDVRMEAIYPNGMRQ